MLDLEKMLVVPAVVWLFRGNNEVCCCLCPNNKKHPLPRQAVMQRSNPNPYIHMYPFLTLFTEYFQRPPNLPCMSQQQKGPNQGTTPQ